MNVSALSRSMMATWILASTSAWAQPASEQKASFPAEIETEIAWAAKSCHGKVVRPIHLVKDADVVGRGPHDYILNYDGFSCNGVDTLCGSGGCRQQVFVAMPDHKLKKVFDDQVNSLDFKRDGQAYKMIVAFHGSVCGGSGPDKCIKTYQWDGSAFKVIGTDTDVEGEADDALQGQGASVEMSKKPEMSKEQHQIALMTFSQYVTFYLIGKRCSEAKLGFTKEMVDKIFYVVKDRSAGISADEKESLWRTLNSNVSTTVLAERDCLQTLGQARFYFPQDVFLSANVPKNPF